MFFYVQSLLFAFLLVFVSCGSKNLDRNNSRKKNGIYDKRDFNSYFYFKALYRIMDDYVDIVEEYRDTNSILSHRVKVYNEMIQVAHNINAQYSKYIENRVLVIEDLIKIKLKVAKLKDEKIPGDVKEMLAEIEKNLEDLISKNTVAQMELEIFLLEQDNREMGDLSEEQFPEMTDSPEDPSKMGDSSEEQSPEMTDSPEDPSKMGDSSEEQSPEMTDSSEDPSKMGDSSEEQSPEMTDSPEDPSKMGDSSKEQSPEMTDSPEDPSKMGDSSEEQSPEMTDSSEDPSKMGDSSDSSEEQPSEMTDSPEKSSEMVIDLPTEIPPLQ